MFSLKKRSTGVPVPPQAAGESQPVPHIRRKTLATPKPIVRTVVGKCPRCGEEVVELSDRFECRQFGEECDFTFRKNKLQKLGKGPLIAAEMTILLEHGAIPLRGLRKEGGQPFDVSGELSWNERWGWGLRFDNIALADSLPPVPSLRRRFLKNP